MAAYNTDMVNDVIRDAVLRRGRGAQSELARTLGVPAQTVNKWMQGQNAPDPGKWTDIEKALELEPGTLDAVARPESSQPNLLERLEALERKVDALISAGLDDRRHRIIERVNQWYDDGNFKARVTFVPMHESAFDADLIEPMLDSLAVEFTHLQNVRVPGGWLIASDDDGLAEGLALLEGEYRAGEDPAWALSRLHARGGRSAEEFALAAEGDPSSAVLGIDPKAKRNRPSPPAADE